MKISKKNWKRKGIVLPLKLWRLEQEVSLQAPCTNFWDKLESIGVIEAKYEMPYGNNWKLFNVDME